MFKVMVDDVKISVVFSYVNVPCKRGEIRREIHCFLHRPGTGKDHKITHHDWVGYGISKYNPVDETLSTSDPKQFPQLKYNSHKGRKIALNRALTNAGFLDNETRNLFWKKFKESEKARRKYAEKIGNAVVNEVSLSL